MGIFHLKSLNKAEYARTVDKNAMPLTHSSNQEWPPRFVELAQPIDIVGIGRLDSRVSKGELAPSIGYSAGNSIGETRWHTLEI